MTAGRGARLHLGVDGETGHVGRGGAAGQQAPGVGGARRVLVPHVRTKAAGNKRTSGRQWWDTDIGLRLPCSSRLTTDILLCAFRGAWLHRDVFVWIHTACMMVVRHCSEMTNDL